MMGLPDIIQALKTPFAVAAALLFLLCVITYGLARLRSSTRALQIRKMAGLAIFFPLVVGAIVVYQSVQQIKHDRQYKEVHAVYSVHVSVRGTVQTRTLSEPVTFKVSSGQINVGCSDAAQTNAVYPVPQDATDIQVTAAWENTDNAKGLSQSVNPSPPVLSATGSISGLDRNFFGNCPGGGHGELVLKGSYRLPRNEAQGQQTLKTLDDKLNKGQALIVAVPHDPNTRPEACDITIEEGNRRQVVHFDLRSVADGTISLANRTMSSMGGDIPVDVSTDKDRILVRIL